MPAVEVAGEFEDARPTRVEPGQANGHECCFGAGGCEADTLGGWNEAFDPLGPLDFALVTGARVGGLTHLPADGFHDFRVAVAEHQGAVAGPVVDEAMSVYVPFVGALGAVDVNRERLHVPDVVGYDVGKQGLGLL